jgi:AcrR family transcriptional regulator
VAGFLRAAAAVITEMGYERATMSAIAAHAHSCIGSLYQFFPNKRSVVEALRAQYINEIEQSWTALGRRAPILSAEDLACRLVDLQIDITKNHPALLDVLMAHKPRMSRAVAVRVASVVLQVSKGLLTLYAQTKADEKMAIIDEFKSVVSGYLVPKLTF